MPTNGNILDRIDKTDERVDKLSAELASHKPVSELVRYILYFWTAISVVLGFFGWSKFAALQDIVADQVRLQLPQSEQQYAKFEELVGKAKRLNEEYEKLAKDYEKSVEALTFADQVGADFDIEGRLTVLILESTRRTQDKASILQGKREDLAGTYLDSEWRKRAIATLNAFRDSIEKKSYPADFIFNVTQICRRLEQFELAEKLTSAAFKKDPSAPITALYLSSRVASTQGTDREEAFNKLMRMIDNLSQDSPQIVIAEAWNAAEDQRRYDSLIDAIDRHIEKGGFTPSYLYVIRAQALLRQSQPGAIKGAENSLKDALVALKSETALSQWFDSTIAEYADQKRIVEQSKMAIQLLDETSSMEGSPTSR